MLFFDQQVFLSVVDIEHPFRLNIKKAAFFRQLPVWCVFGVSGGPSVADLLSLIFDFNARGFNLLRQLLFQTASVTSDETLLPFRNRGLPARPLRHRQDCRLQQQSHLRPCQTDCRLRLCLQPAR